ncbi:hypothetical protein ROZALSC1DRAFT_24458 [Rozella allomycis CSF55]|uniref:Uncharacterized protein n=1 Tax=Rozella allomycis (strain CSF55) TaxID=988480 RepID=A0A4P9YDD3_ROZAC|nr:hypothetical protein ROZALSC1DRAFT_24458 [Rozella allomycis CSF55]
MESGAGMQKRPRSEDSDENFFNINNHEIPILKKLRHSNLNLKRQLESLDEPHSIKKMKTVNAENMEQFNNLTQESIDLGQCYNYQTLTIHPLFEDYLNKNISTSHRLLDFDLYNEEKPEDEKSPSNRSSPTNTGALILYNENPLNFHNNQFCM